MINIVHMYEAVKRAWMRITSRVKDDLSHSTGKSHPSMYGDLVIAV